MRNHPKLKGDFAYYSAKLRREPEIEAAPGWRRAVAFALDYGVLYFALVRAGTIEYFFFLAQINPDQLDRYFYFKMGVQAVVVLYFAMTEGGEWSASIGKRLLGLKLVTSRGISSGFIRALFRASFLIFPTHLVAYAFGTGPGVAVATVTLLLYWFSDLALVGTQVVSKKL